MLKNLHHANLLIGSLEASEFYLHSLCEKAGIKLSNNPNYTVFKIETFGIEEARELKLLSAHKSIPIKSHIIGNNEKDSELINGKIFFIAPIRLTLQAQNALLKTFEDPHPNTFFFLVLREEGLIISTLRSRMQIIHVSEIGDPVDIEVKKFLALPIKERLLFAQKFAEEKKRLPIFLDNLLLLLKQRKGEEKSLKKVYAIRKLIRESDILPRVVIEHLALVL